MAVEYKYEVDSVTNNISKKLMCIEYPGLVNNVDKMLNTLGGIDNIGVAYSTKNRRVELRFRPDDIYCKPTCGDKHSTTALLLKVKVKKKSRDLDTPCSSKDADKPQIITFTTSIIGVVDTIYRFNNLSDFQYLPMDVKKGDPAGGKLENIHDRLRPNILPTVGWLKILSLINDYGSTSHAELFNKNICFCEIDDNVPLFLTPPVFSRFDSVHYYNAQKVKDPNINSRIIGRTRKRRTGYAIFISVKDDKVPQKPIPEAIKMLHVKFLKDEHYEKIKKLFEERPVWSKNAIVYHTNFSKDQLKLLLPAVAYYFVTGPWRVMWVRYGYDPRKDPEARKYQTFDYRMRTDGGLKNRIKAKRSYSNCLLPYKNSPASKPKVAIITRHSIAKAYKSANSLNAKEILDENTYIFRPGMIPPFRQMFYQYCDVLIPEIQHMIARVPLGNAGEKCDLQSGWLPHGFDSNCREIVSNLVSAEIRKQMLQQQKLKRKKEEEEYEEEDDNYEDFDIKAEDLNTSREIEISDSENSSDSSIDVDLESDEDCTDGLIDSDLDECLKDV